MPYFYEPFLEAFDPRLRKQLGVWYTPNEVVRYMVARVDRALKDDLGIADGLAADNVYVLDPCCGTGAYLAEVLRRIAENLRGQGLGALTGARVKQAATERVFGFEIMPAPFVIAHLQVGLTMQSLDAPLTDDGNERAGVFLTNALTGWEPTVQKPLLIAELEEERERASRVKQDTPILVIIGNPPYNGFAGVASRRRVAAIPSVPKPISGCRPDTRGLERPVRPLLPHGRAAHRREDRPWHRLLHLQLLLARWTVVHWHAGALLEVFDADPHRLPQWRQVQNREDAPDGSPDPSDLLHAGRSGRYPRWAPPSRRSCARLIHAPAVESIGFRHLWGQAKREELVQTADPGLEPGLYERP